MRRDPTSPASPASPAAQGIVPPASARRLHPASALWRIALMMAIAALLVAGQIQRTNDYFPFGTLEQYARGVDPNGEVANTCLRGERADGTALDIPFGAGVGIQRADLENNLKKYEKDPSGLAILAQRVNAAHPAEPPLKALVICREVTTLRHGAPAGDPAIVELVRWEAP